jgi:hypothetical protein
LIDTTDSDSDNSCQDTDSSENSETESGDSFDTDSYDDSSSLSESESSETSVSSASEADTVLLSPNEEEENQNERMDEYAVMHDVMEEERRNSRRLLQARRDADEAQALRLERRYDRGEPIFRGMQTAYAHIAAFLLAMDRRPEAREALFYLARETREAREAREDRDIDSDSESILDPNVFP